MITNKKKILAALAILIVLLSILIVFINKSDKAEKKIKNEYDYSLVFDYYNENIKTQSLTFNYKNKRLQNIVLTLIFPTKSAAKQLYKEYKTVEEYANVKLDGKKIILNYSKDSVSMYTSLTKEEIISLEENAGYRYVASDK